LSNFLASLFWRKGNWPDFCTWCQEGKNRKKPKFLPFWILGRFKCKTPRYFDWPLNFI